MTGRERLLDRAVDIAALLLQAAGCELGGDDSPFTLRAFILDKARQELAREAQNKEPRTP